MSVVELTAQWSPTERAAISTFHRAMAGLGNCNAIEFDEDDVMSFCSMIKPDGSTWLCLVKTTSGIQAFRHEQPNPSWEGPTVWDFLNGAFQVAAA